MRLYLVKCSLFACCLVVGLGLGFGLGLDLVSCYAHVFVLLSVVIVTLPV